MHHLYGIAGQRAPESGVPVDNTDGRGCWVSSRERPTRPDPRPKRSAWLPLPGCATLGRMDVSETDVAHLWRCVELAREALGDC